MPGTFEKITPPRHVCNPPGLWHPAQDLGPPRRRFGVGTTWRCDCGQRWVIPLGAGYGWQRMRG